jgi:hypothetical protein
LKEAFTKANGRQSNVRYLKINIMDDKFELVGTGNSGTASLDFNSFSRNLNSEEPCYIAFRFKDTFADAPWALIMFTPESLPIKEKNQYISCFVAVRDGLGMTYFSKLKKYTQPSDFKWIQFINSESDKVESKPSFPAVRSPPHTTPKSPGSSGNASGSGSGNFGKPPSSGNFNKPSGSAYGNSGNPGSGSGSGKSSGMSLSQSQPPTSSAVEEKPWSQRELALQELEREEEMARRDMEQRAVPVIGLAKVEFPLADPLVESVHQLCNGDHNWIQVTLNEPPNQLELVESKTVSEDDLISVVDPKKPQFYIYNRYNESIVVIYCSPEPVKGEQRFAQARQNRMVYATAKSSLLSGLTNLNLSLPLKQYNIEEPSELEESKLNVHLLSKSADIRDAKLLVGGSNNSSMIKGPGYRANYQAPSPLASLMLANPGLKKPMPKAGATPPRGAYY